MKPPARYLPDRPFPAYAFLPGRDAHPTRDPKGHSYTGEAEPPAEYFDATDWQDNEDYLFGVDLYNYGYLWEAHEAWEGLWHQAKHDKDQAEMLQGLIQCTAAALKVPMHQPKGLLRLSEIGTGSLENVGTSAGPSYMGVEIFDFIEAFREFAESEPRSADERPPLELVP